MAPSVDPSSSLMKNLSFFPKPESADAHQRSHDLGIQIGYQRRNKEVLAWVKKRRRTIRREDLISFLCGKAPPPRTTRAPPRVTMVPTSRPSTPETGSSVETDLQPFREAIALHGGLLSPSIANGFQSPSHSLYLLWVYIRTQPLLDFRGR